MGIYGNYWSSTAYPDVNNAYYFYFDSANTQPSLYYARTLGFSVRGATFNLTVAGVST